MANADLLIDILSDLEQRSALDTQSSIDELLASDSELQAQLARDPELASEVRRALAALRDLDSYLGRHAAADKQALPTIPGYTIESELGFGGMGTVYKAQQESLKRTVAVKVIWKHGLRSHLYDKRVRAEAEMVARLEHPHIVQIYETGETPTAHFLVLEYLSAGNLADRLDGRPQPERFSAEIVYTIARTVEYAHSRGIIHRDLKPSNILQATDGSLKIADFGLAKMQDVDSNLTASGEALGTPGYMAPEQTRGKYSERTDVYSLGAILYELLTGRPPFSGETAAETLVQVQTNEPIAPRLIRSRLSPDLEAICLKCLEKDPARRYASAHELADDLDRFTAGRPTIARLMSSPQKLVRLAQRQPLAAGLIAGILLLLLAVTAISTVSAIWINRARREAENIAQRESEARAEANELRLQAEQHVRDLEVRDRRLRREVYTANIQRAFELNSLSDWNAARSIVREFPPENEDDVRGFEWYFLKHELSRPGETELNPPGGPCFYVCYSPDGRLILAGTEQGFVTIWDAVTLVQVHCWKAHDSCVNMICFSPDGQLIVTTSCDKTARFWHASDWQPAGEPMRREQPIFRCAFTPDGNRLITTTDIRKSPRGTVPEITVWDVSTRSPVTSRTALPGHIIDMELGLEGQRIVTMNINSHIQEWSLEGSTLTEVQHNLLPDPDHGGFAALAMAPDQRTIIYSSVPNRVEIADLITHKTRHWPGVNVIAHCLNVSPDGRYVAVGDRGANAWIRQMEDGSLIETLRNVGNTHALCFSPDCKRLVAATQQGRVLVNTLDHPARSGRKFPVRNAIGWQTKDFRGDARLNAAGTRLWHKGPQGLVADEPATGLVLKMFENCVPGKIQDWEISPDELSAVVTIEGTAQNHYFLLRREPDSEQERIVAEFDSQLTPRFNARSSCIAAYVTGKLSMRDATDGSELRTYSLLDKTTSPPQEYRGRLRWFDGGNEMLVPLVPNAMRCDLSTGEWAKLGPLQVRADIAESGTWLVDSDANRRVVVRDGVTGTAISDLGVLGSFPDLSPDGQRIVFVANRTVRILDIETGKEVFTFIADEDLYCAKFSGDGLRLVLIGLADVGGNAKTWTLFADSPDDSNVSAE
ncbi:MAG TPA: serine/threonine-protein kinase [Pirellulales bacterium]|jgi:serine/threonine protein kinase/WD40 repeat protein